MLLRIFALLATICLAGQTPTPSGDGDIHFSANVASLVTKDIDELSRKHPNGPWQQLVAELKLHEVRVVDEVKLKPENMAQRFVSDERPEVAVVYIGPRDQQDRLLKFTRAVSARCISMNVRKDDFGITTKTLGIDLQWEGSLFVDTDSDVTFEGYGFTTFQVGLTSNSPKDAGE